LRLNDTPNAVGCTYICIYVWLNEACHAFPNMSHSYECDMSGSTHGKMSGTGWRKPTGCLKLYVSFRKRATNYRSLLREMTYRYKASYGSSPPCTTHGKPQTEEIGLKIFTTVKISNKYSRESTHISNTFSRESSDFHTSFHVCQRSPRHSKDPTRNSLNFEIEIFEV